MMNIYIKTVADRNTRREIYEKLKQVKYINLNENKNEFEDEIYICIPVPNIYYTNYKVKATHWIS